jgi:dipeptidase E
MSARLPQIIAMGGGGFSMEPENPALDRYILAQTGATRPRVAFLPTATGDAPLYIVNFYTAFSRFECHPSHLTLFGRTPDLNEYLLNQDVIYVGGGNTKSMLAVWRDWGLAEILYTAWQQGVVLAGVSAGAICWFQAGLTDSWGGVYKMLPCLGFLPGSCTPHYDGEPERRPTFQGFIQRGETPAGYALDDAAALHFVGDTLAHVVTTRPDAHAYRVELKNGLIDETAISPINILAGA